MVLQLRAKGAEASHFLHRQEKPHLCVCLWCWVGAHWGKFQPWQWWKMLGMFGGVLYGSPVNLLWRSFEVLAVGLNDFGGQTQWSWRSFPASVRLWLYSIIPSSTGGSMEVPHCSKLTHPAVYIIFHSSVEPQSWPWGIWVDPGWHWLPTTKTSQSQHDLQPLFGRAEVGAALTDPGPCSDQVPSTSSALF